ncbi:MAG: hypothetical protein V4617_19560 [Gemmatimonadota bacterium]
MLQGCGSADDADAEGRRVPAASTGAAGPATAGGIAPKVDTVNGIMRWTHDSAAYASAPRWTLDTTLIGETPGAGGDASFDLTYADIVRLTSDNKVVALAPVGNSFTVFSAEGRPLHRYFRTGSGPGDLMRPSGLFVLAGDTILVPDEGNQRLNWVHPDRGMVRSAPMARLVGTDRLSVREHVGMAGNRMIAVAQRYGALRPGDDTTGRDDLRVLQLEQTGAMANEVLRLLGPLAVPYETRYRGRVAVQRTPPRLAPHPAFAVWNDQVVVGSGAQFDLGLWSPAGTQVAQLAVALRLQPVTKGMRDAMIAKEVEQFNGQHSERMVDPAESRRLIDARPWADSVPAYHGLHPTRTGLLWVASYPVIGEGQPWTAIAFGLGGALLGRVDGRVAGVPLTFGDDRVVVREEDADGVVRFRIYRLRPPR